MNKPPLITTNLTTTTRRFFSCLVLFGVLSCGSDAVIPDAGPDATAEGTFSISWSVAGANGPVTCSEVGASRVRITVIEVDAAFGSVVGFDCDALSGTSRALLRGNYRLTIDLQMISGESLLAAPLQLNDVVIEGGQNTVVEAQVFTVIP